MNQLPLSPGRGGEPLAAPTAALHADFAPAAAFAASDQNRSASRVEVELGQGQRFLDAYPGVRENHDQRADAVAVEVFAGVLASLSARRTGSRSRSAHGRLGVGHGHDDLGGILGAEVWNSVRMRA